MTRLDRQALLAEARALQGQPAGASDRWQPATVSERSLEGQTQCRLSAMFFASSSAGAQDDPYGLVLEAAAWADQAGFDALWLPERHFAPFGGPYPNPAVLAAAVAQVTKRLRIRAGSVVLPLHDPLEVAEAWAMVDQLSGGRVDLAFGSGWNPDDFALAPQAFAQAREDLPDQIDEFLRLWGGQEVSRLNGKGEAILVRTYPRPVQDAPGIWISSTSNPDSFARAGRDGRNVLTMVLGGSLADVAERIQIYRSARAEVGLDPVGGCVTLMLHTYVDPDESRLLDRVRGPMGRYVADALKLHAAASEAAGPLDAAQQARIADFALERYLAEASLIGTPASVQAMLARVRDIGVTEVACLLDFGLERAEVMEGLHQLGHVTGMSAPQQSMRAARGVSTPETAPDVARDVARDVAIIGMACRLPGAPDLARFAALLIGDATALGPPPAGRWSDSTGPVALPAGGFIADVEQFDPAPFRIAAREAALMDPHQRLFLQSVWHALENAGLRAQDLRGRAVGVFASVYSTSYLQRVGVQDGADRSGSDDSSDPLAIPGRLNSMVANRTSFVFDWKGPSETIDTACSSGLVALHRAIAALRAEECELAVVGGVSLLLSDLESHALARLGLLDGAGLCRAFDQAASGQARGEGVGVLVLRRADLLGPSERALAHLKGSAVGHAGGGSGSLTLPSKSAQARTIAKAWQDAGLSPAKAGYVEAHGAGTLHGDRCEVSALRAAFTALGASGSDWVIGSCKPRIGSLDAAGGIAAVIAAVLALDHQICPGLATLDTPAPDLGLPTDSLRLAARATTTCSQPLEQAAVHSYGLGGVSAHVVLDRVAEGPRSMDRPMDRPMDAGAAEPCVLTVSGWDQAAVLRQSQALADWLDTQEHISLCDLAYSLAHARDPMAARAVYVVDRLDALIALLRAPAPEGGGPRLAPDLPLNRPEVQAAQQHARAILDGADPIDTAPPGHMLALPGYAFEPRHFPIVPAAVPQTGAAAGTVSVSTSSAPVAAYYDHVAEVGGLRQGPLYLTLAPFPDPVPGFSWTRTMQSPETYPEHADLMQQAQRQMREVLTHGAGIGPGSRVLDFGCGFATDLIDMASRHPGLQGVGYTIAPEQARAAQARVASAGLSDRIQIYNRDSATQAFPGPFDCAIGYEVGHHIENKSGLFRNLAQAIRPGGRLLLIDCAADTAQTIALPGVGSWTNTLAEYADLLSTHGFALHEVTDASREVGNFLIDPHLETMIAEETRRAGAAGDLVAQVQRSWDGFGQALRDGLIRYLLISAERVADGSLDVGYNRERMGLV